MSVASTVADGADNFRRIGPSSRARSVWAKSCGVGEWLPLTQHMLDSAAMAERLFDHWLAPGTRRRWASSFPGGEDDARATFVFLASAHDVGKAAPVFVAQVETFADRARRAGLECAVMDELRDDRKVLPHATVSFLALEPWLRRRGARRGLARQLASVVGAHHGRPVSGNAGELSSRRLALGGKPWADVRDELLDWADDRHDFSARLAGWGPSFRIPLPVQVGMCGLVIMADWLASNQDYFPLRAADDDLTPAIPSDDAAAARAEWGWGEVAMPHAWAPAVPQDELADLYRRRFGWDGDRTPRPLQVAVTELARDAPVGLMIVESDMGSGKTEAAFAAAEILGARWGAQGVFVALPTQATTDAMFSRMLPWLDALPKPPEDVPKWAMTLAHGKASLNREYARTEGIADVRDDDHSPTSAVAHQWFRGPKRRLLANFGIGTIDQILMAGLQQKHLMLRHLALAGKVVVIDECHAADHFMQIYLDTVLNWLGHYGVPVIALSATLTTERRRRMVQAYAPDATGDIAEVGYPQITWVSTDRSRVHVRATAAHAEPRHVTWDWLEDDDDALLTVLERELAEGGCALVVRNTVKDAQRVVDLVRDRVCSDVSLAHSRFLAADRAANDESLRQRYGPQSGLGSRPERSVVVATQVVEQSLDVDFDVLITDLAPMDLLFQRIGRLHRHSWRTRPPGLEEARVHVIADRSGPVPTGNRGSRFVYGDHHLLRTALVLEDHGHDLKLPDDIPRLVERALGGATLPAPTQAAALLDGAAADHRATIDRQRVDASDMSLEIWDPEDRDQNLGHWLNMVSDPSEARIGAMVRDTRPSLEVVVVPLAPDGAHALVPPWMPEQATLDTSSLPDDTTAARIASWTVKLPMSVTPWPARLDAVIDELQRGVARGWAWHRHRLLKGALFLPMHCTSEGSTTLETTLFADGPEPVTLRYSPERGLEEVRDDVQPGR